MAQETSGAGGAGGAVVITGASTGIGRECALYLDRRGYRVFAGVRREEDGAALRAAASERLIPLLIDVTKKEQIDEAAQLVGEALGDKPLTGLVNNAGIGIAGPMEYIAIDDVRLQFEVNFFGPIVVTQAFLPLLRRGLGRIVNIGSAGGRFTAPFMAPYCASKSALRALTEAQRMELRPWGIWACLIEPGAIKTPIWDKGEATTRQIRGRLEGDARERYVTSIDALSRGLPKFAKFAIPPERVARRVEHALSARRPKTNYLVGPDAYALALLRWLLPQRAFEWALRKPMELL